MRDPSAPEHELVGTEIEDRYRVEKLLARGGMGAIYEGVHNTLGRRVAIKVLSRRYAKNEEAMSRFLREARTASRMDHPNIVAILDFGRLEHGEPYLVMELLEGRDLAHLIEHESPIKPARVLELLTPIAAALDAVHRQGLVHRDVKPANIFLAVLPDGSVIPKLLDFGLTAFLDPKENERLTREGIVVGTPHYVSPEAAEGAPTDHRTDVYSLGLVAFELLTGLLPIDNVRAMSLLYDKVRRPAPTLSQRSGKSFPAPLEQLVARTLSRNPERRPASAGELMVLFEEAITSTPESADRAPAPSSRTARPSAPLMALAAIALVLAVSIGVSVLSFANSRRAISVGSSAPTLTPSAEQPIPDRLPRGEDPPALLTTRRASRHVHARRPSNVGAPAAEHDPEHAAALTDEGLRALLHGQIVDARRILLEATEADPTHAAAWRGLGLASERMELVPEAAEAYRTYLALEPEASDRAEVQRRLDRLATTR